jgi:hypothetical protein
LEVVAVKGERVAISGLAHDASSITSHALLRDIGQVNGLSSERMLLQYGKRDQMLSSAAENRLELVEAKQFNDGSLHRYRIPDDITAGFGLPPETCIGAYVGPHHAAYGFFYRPLHQLSDVAAHFSMLRPQDSTFGVLLPGSHLEILDQKFFVSSSAGVHTISRPLGMPARSKSPLADGFVWVEPARDKAAPKVVFESSSVRISTDLRPKRSEGDSRSRDINSAAARVREHLSTIKKTSWR